LYRNSSPVKYSLGELAPVGRGKEGIDPPPPFSSTGSPLAILFLI
jgi:hypothetical protein